MIYQRMGALLYIVWGMLHLVAAQKVLSLGQSLEEGMVQGRIYQDAFYLLFFAIFGIYVAIRYNWKNEKLGYWLNLVIISAADIPYILFVLIPGYVPLVPGVYGPVVWLLAVVFSTIAIVRAKNT